MDSKYVIKPGEESNDGIQVVVYRCSLSYSFHMFIKNVEGKSLVCYGGSWENICACIVLFTMLSTIEECRGNPSSLSSFLPSGSPSFHPVNSNKVSTLGWRQIQVPLFPAHLCSCHIDYFLCLDLN